MYTTIAAWSHSIGNLRFVSSMVVNDFVDKLKAVMVELLRYCAMHLRDHDTYTKWRHRSSHFEHISFLISRRSLLFLSRCGDLFLLLSLKILIQHT